MLHRRLSPPAFIVRVGDNEAAVEPAGLIDARRKLHEAAFARIIGQNRVRFVNMGLGIRIPDRLLVHDGQRLSELVDNIQFGKCPLPMGRGLKWIIAIIDRDEVAIRCIVGLTPHRNEMVRSKWHGSSWDQSLLEGLRLPARGSFGGLDMSALDASEKMIDEPRHRGREVGKTLNIVLQILLLLWGQSVFFAQNLFGDILQDLVDVGRQRVRRLRK
ncbi:uncharacterized protein N7482_001085 [Penicillium canariense]|uniref:Uncharacterized protein n=1 Tax=Penicillium canariense TaxID=189055 RepID=A0A9W9ICM7_9EURO|nr:uncharacterized protein N7482_001085 [Penicillium canariense]KAJ5175208.1 hypothetical protein N7482_001085 [Penicillium canariense]